MIRIFCTVTSTNLSKKYFCRSLLTLHSFIAEAPIEEDKLQAAFKSCTSGDISELMAQGKGMFATIACGAAPAAGSAASGITSLLFPHTSLHLSPLSSLLVSTLFTVYSPSFSLIATAAPAEEKKEEEKKEEEEEEADLGLDLFG